MRFSVYQVSRRGGREKNEDRMGYCYTRDAGLFALADGMGGHPEGDMAAQLALQTLAAMFQREAKPTLADPLRFLHERHHRRPPPVAALRHVALAGRHAAHHAGGLRAAGQRGLLGALRRFAPVPGARRQAHRPHPRPFLHRAAGNLAQVVPMGESAQPQRALHLPGQPGQADGRHRGTAAVAPGRPRAAVLRRPVERAARQS
jgi:hypothetical protein